MFEKLEVIYDYGDHKGKELNQEMEERITFKNIKPGDAKKILEVIDQENVPVEDVINFFRLISNKGKEVKNKMANNEKKFSEAEARVNIYQKEHPGISYREAVLKCGLKSSEEERLVSKDFSELTKDEVLRAKKLIDDVIYNLSLAKTSKSFPESEQNKLDQAYELVKSVSKSMEILVEKNK